MPFEARAALYELPSQHTSAVDNVPWVKKDRHGCEVTVYCWTGFVNYNAFPSFLQKLFCSEGI